MGLAGGVRRRTRAAARSVAPGSVGWRVAPFVLRVVMANCHDGRDSGRPPSRACVTLTVEDTRDRMDGRINCCSGLAPIVWGHGDLSHSELEGMRTPSSCALPLLAMQGPQQGPHVWWSPSAGSLLLLRWTAGVGLMGRQGVSGVLACWCGAARRAGCVLVFIHERMEYAVYNYR